MLQISYIRKNIDKVKEGLEKRNFQEPELVFLAIEIDDKRRNAQQELDAANSEMNKISKEIGMLFKAGKREEAEKAKQQTSRLKEKIKNLKEELSHAEEKLISVLSQIPNIPHDSVPKGKDEKDNEIIFEHGEIPHLTESAMPHWELAEKYQLIDFETGAKVTGAGFPFYTGKGARLQRALINFFLDEGIKAGYKEVIPPYVVNEASGFGTGQLPDKEGQMYHVCEDDLYLIPTAEVPVTNIYRDVILKETDFPVKNVAYSPCFRREAGSYGKDVRGLNRLHQFEKVEIVQIAHPHNSYQVLDEMVEYVKQLLIKLELPFRIVRLCGGDLGFTSALTYDMEVYSAAQKRWLEVSSISNFETYQANRLKLRYKDANGKTHLAHTLNGSALALPRIFAALLENNQTPQGINLPEILTPYTGFETIN